MESNKDEALKCLSIAQKHRNAANYPSARRFCQKSINLFSTAEAVKLLEIIESDEASSSASSTSGAGASSTAAEAHPSAAGARHRHPAGKEDEKDGGSGAGARGHGAPKKSYTEENMAVVKRVRACKATEYYEILSLKRECEEGEVKKAYRKVCCGKHHSPRKLVETVFVGGALSSLSRCTLTRMVHLVPMKHLRVSVV